MLFEGWALIKIEIEADSKFLAEVKFKRDMETTLNGVRKRVSTAPEFTVKGDGP